MAGVFCSYIPQSNNRPILGETMISTHAIGSIQFIGKLKVNDNPEWTFLDLTILCAPGRTKYRRIHRIVPVHIDLRAYGLIAESIHRESSTGDTIEVIGILERMRGLTSAHLVNKLKIERWELISKDRRSIQDRAIERSNESQVE